MGKKNFKISVSSLFLNIFFEISPFHWLIQGGGSDTLFPAWKCSVSYSFQETIFQNNKQAHPLCGGHWYPLFWTSNDVQNQGGSLACVLHCLYAVDSSHSPLVRHLLTSCSIGKYLMSGCIFYLATAIEFENLNNKITVSIQVNKINQSMSQWALKSIPLIKAEIVCTWNISFKGTNLYLY